MRVDKEVLNVLSAAECHGKNLVLTGQLDRNLYTRTNKVLEAAGGKWSRKCKAHVFDIDASERIEQIILTGDVVVPKDDFEFFPTPPEVVRHVIHLADIRDGMHVLEPSAGQGAIAKAAHSAAADVMIDMYELMPANNDALHALNLRLSGIGKPVDFLTVEPNPVYDRVVMNPPFSRQADIKHVTHALKFLKTDGLLVSVMASPVVFRSNKLTSDFRQLIEDRGGHIEELPEGSFKSSGTMVNTVVVMIPN
ncbi:methyltransferase [Mixta gaviniae]|uniref:SAM-dependent methyltransferase n=1 Tax=Mixta gaviniae TaxID=665914 RepID=A0A1X1EEK8_9GAMM|nr:methyltransferase [Mixta gaviniae]AUX94276.1 SAM-dependent methyltransferase [Mixta gaviniae]ORM87346.1 restriction endonuclease subunit M [Mixta gaviniae]